MKYSKKQLNITNFICNLLLVIISVVNSQTTSMPAINNATNEGDNEIAESNEDFCVVDPNQPFQRLSDGSVCCRGVEIPYVTVTPDVTGECAISTKTNSNGILKTPALVCAWCAYSCTLKKMGLVNKDNSVIPDKLFDHLAKVLSAGSKTIVKSIMEKYLNCYKPIKNANFPCYSALGFHKCYKDALEYLCSHNMPANNDFSLLKKPDAVYENLVPSCHYNNTRAMPGCCHGKPLPWTITEILEAPRNETKKSQCVENMGAACDGTCYLSSVDAVNEAMEIDVDKFAKSYLQYFPTIQPSGWMYFAGPTFLFYDELVVEDDGVDESDSTQKKVCMFHDQILQLHANKVYQYCNMQPEEVAELLKANAVSNSTTT